ETAVGVDVDLGHAELRGAGKLVVVDAPGRGVERAAGGVDALHFTLWDAAAAVHDQREAGQRGLNGLDAVEVQPLGAGELVRAVAGADGHGQAVAARLFDEQLRL